MRLQGATANRKGYAMANIRTALVITETYEDFSTVNVVCSKECHKEFMSAFIYGLAYLSTNKEVMNEPTNCDKCHKRI